MSAELPRIVPVNRTSVISLIAALLTVLSFCTAVAPIPFTGYVCFPGAAVLGLVAFFTGLSSLAQIRSRQENGRIYALIGISIGALTLVAALCATALGILFFPRIVALLHQYIH